MVRFCSLNFTSNGSFVAPAGVTRVYLIGQGGGGGGSGGQNSTFQTSYGGAGTTPYMKAVDVVPNTSYTITIGTAGAGGAARTTTTQNGGAGGNTTFGALWTFQGAPAAQQPSTFATNLLGIVQNGTTAGQAGCQISSGYVTESQNAFVFAGSYSSGIDGVPGWVGSTRGIRGLGNAAGAGAAATGGSGIGFGGGSGGCGSTAGGAGGNGGPGQLWVVWLE